MKKGRKLLPAQRSAEERNALVERNLELAHWCVKRFLRATPRAKRLAEDLTQEALLALIRAGDLWDAARGIQFSTYATWAIDHQLIRAWQRAEVIHLPCYIQGEERQDLRQRLAPVELPPELVGPGVDPTWPVEVDDLVQAALSQLPARLAGVIAQRVAGRSCQEIGRGLGVSIQRAQQLLKKAQQKLEGLAASLAA